MVRYFDPYRSSRVFSAIPIAPVTPPSLVPNFDYIRNSAVSAINTYSRSLLEKLDQEILKLAEIILAQARRERFSTPGYLDENIRNTITSLSPRVQIQGRVSLSGRTSEALVLSFSIRYPIQEYYQPAFMSPFLEESGARSFPVQTLEVEYSLIDDSLDTVPPSHQVRLSVQKRVNGVQVLFGDPELEPYLGPAIRDSAFFPNGIVKPDWLVKNHNHPDCAKHLEGYFFKKLAGGCVIAGPKPLPETADFTNLRSSLQFNHDGLRITVYPLDFSKGDFEVGFQEGLDEDAEERFLFRNFTPVIHPALLNDRIDLAVLQENYLKYSWVHIQKVNYNRN